MTRLNDFSSFSKATPDSINQRLQRELKDIPVESLTWKNENGFDLNPIYLTNPRPQSEAGVIPYLRGNKSDRLDWLMRQDFDFVPGVGRKIMTALESGVSSLGLVFPKSGKGVLSDELKGVMPDLINMNFHFDGNAGSQLTQILGWFKENTTGSGSLKGTIVSTETELLAGIVKGDFQELRYAGIDTSVYCDKGAISASEIAIALAALHEQLLSLMRIGLSIDQASGRVALRMGVGGSYFVELSKMRVMRELYAELVMAYRPEHDCSQNLFLSAVTTRWNKTIPDIHNNLLRTTTEAMSAAIGGVDELTVRPFDELVAENDDIGLRLARNIQYLLTEESRLNTTADPAGGSYYIENLTEKLADIAWKGFQSIEANGGFGACNKSGYIEEMLKKDASSAIESVSTGKRIVVGVNKYKPAKNEHEIMVDGRLTSRFEMKEATK